MWLERCAGESAVVMVSGEYARAPLLSVSAISARLRLGLRTGIVLFSVF